jgi:anion-transporting  ArsA/GET3 family ATPase
MSAPRRPDLSGKRLLVVTGKGGVGKSTVAAALAIAAARRGRKTIVAEVAARSDVASNLLGANSAGPRREVALAPALHHVSIEPRGALAEYIRNEVPGRVPGMILARSRAFDVLATATPGLRELLTVGKVWELAQRPRRTPGARPYDLVILDAPASGHAAALLGAPRTFASIANVGPVARQGAAIDRMLRDRRSTGVIAVATPEQMAVSETLELRRILDQNLEIALDGVVVNRVLPARFSAAEARTLAGAPDDPPVRSARWFAARARAQRGQIARLRRGLRGVPGMTLPFLFGDDFGRAQVEALALKLERWRA